MDMVSCMYHIYKWPEPEIFDIYWNNKIIYVCSAQRAHSATVPSNHAEDINAAEDALKGKKIQEKMNYRHVKRINKES